MKMNNIKKSLTQRKIDMNSIKTFKFVAGTIVSCGAMAVVVGALKIPIQNSKGLTKLMMRLGVFVLGCKAGDIAEKYFDETVDKVTEAIKDIKEELPNEPSAVKQ